MAYRRRQGITRAATFTEDLRPRAPLHEDDKNDDPRRIKDLSSRSHSFSPSSSSFSPSSSSSTSLAAQAIKASAAHRDSPLSSAYGDSTSQSSFNDPSKAHGDSISYTSFNELSKGAFDMRNANETGGSNTFWGVLAKKAKSLLDDEPLEEPGQKNLNSSTNGSYYPPYQAQNNSRKVDNPKLRKSLDAFASSLNHIGDQIGNAFEEGRTKIENKTADIIQETRRLQIRRNAPNFDDPSYSSGMPSPFRNFNKPTQHTMNNQDERLKAARDVAMATAAKAKVLLRELKTVKADLAFAKERSSQLEDENKVLREACDKGGHPEDDDMIRHQLETLLAEKARLAHENSVYARENRFLREIVEYHQLTMQDVVYLDEGIEEVTEVYPIPAVSRRLSSASSPPSPSSPRLSHDEYLSEYFSRSTSLKSSSHIAQNDSKDYQLNKSPISSNSSPSSMDYSNRW